ncbi:MAG TPA: hypothetical protein VGR73_05335 [Bryobacteraceae bacterium]|nr:hypothetical protein [Bryobacteraceae bacterium]
MTLFFFTTAFLAPAPATAQWLHNRDPAIPRTRDRKPNLAAKAPRTRDGHPDLSGIWHPAAALREQILRYFKDGINGLGEDDPDIYFLTILEDFGFKDAPLTPAAAAIFRARAAELGAGSPPLRCQPWRGGSVIWREVAQMWA